MSPVAIPMVIMPLTFLFVLLIILVAKAPRVGAWVVGGLLFLAPILLLRFAHAGAIHGPQALPLFVVPLSFLFVLLIILLTKAPKAGAGLIVAIVVMVVAGLFLIPVVAHRRASYAPRGDAIRSEWQEIVTEHGADRVQVWEDGSPSSGVATIQVPSPTLPTPEQRAAISVHGGDIEATSGGAHVRLSVPAMPPAPASPQPPSPIWSEGVEQEFEADVYPSSLAAAKALGRRMAQPIRTAAGDPNGGIKVILFQESNERSLVAAFGHGLEKELPDARYSIEADLRNIQPGEVGLTLRVDMANQVVTMTDGATMTLSNPGEGTRIVATAFTTDRRASAEARYIDKPWVENFGSYASARPNTSFVVARSNEACMSEGEAHNQALADAYAQVTSALSRQRGRGLAGQLPEGELTITDVLNGKFILDRFVQSFDTSTGKVWRQALLLDVSGPRLALLARVKAARTHQVRESWAVMGFSAIGALVLIAVIYFFLNMATRGYYEWSLRIAGVILAIVAIVSILMIVQ